MADEGRPAVPVARIGAVDEASTGHVRAADLRLVEPGSGPVAIAGLEAADGRAPGDDGSPVPTARLESPPSASREPGGVVAELGPVTPTASAGPVRVADLDGDGRGDRGRRARGRRPPPDDRGRRPGRTSGDTDEAGAGVRRSRDAGEPGAGVRRSRGADGTGAGGRRPRGADEAGAGAGRSREGTRAGDRPRRPAGGPRPIDPDADPLVAAREICLTLLTDRARTKHELADALRRRAVPDEAAAAVLDRFDEVGLIDDAAFAGQWVRSRQRTRGLARRALAVELRRKGVEDEVAAEALAEVDPEAEEERARELVARKLRTLAAETPEQRATAARRLVGMLGRKGYPGGVAYRVVREALAAHGAEDDELGTVDEP